MRKRKNSKAFVNKVKKELRKRKMDQHHKCPYFIERD